MRKVLLAASLALAAFASAGAANACGSNTVAMLEGLSNQTKPTLSRCGSEFNNMLIRAHKHDWRGALAAYELHLARLGKWEAGSDNAEATLAYLRKRAGT